MALGFWYNSNQPGSTGPVNLTEAQWRAGVAVFFNDVDSIETKQVQNPDTDWVDTPYGQYWYGNGPGTFQPTTGGTASAAETNTVAEGDPTISG